MARKKKKSTANLPQSKEEKAAREAIVRSEVLSVQSTRGRTAQVSRGFFGTPQLQMAGDITEYLIGGHRDDPGYGGGSYSAPSYPSGYGSTGSTYVPPRSSAPKGNKGNKGNKRGYNGPPPSKNDPDNNGTIVQTPVWTREKYLEKLYESGVKERPPEEPKANPPQWNLPKPERL